MPKKQPKKPLKIVMIAGSRGEYGYLRPIIREIEVNKVFDYEIIACNMHPLDTFGSSIGEIEHDGLKIGGISYNTLDGYNHHTMAKSLGIFLLELPGLIERTKPDWILIAGDRGEQFMAAIAGAHMYLPVAHIQAGELSGNIDGAVRHAITKLAHLHFCANEDAVRRVKKMGEEEFRVHHVGAPQLDELLNSQITSRSVLAKSLGLDFKQPLILVAQHSVTEEFDQAEFQMAETMKAIASLALPTVIILNNSDAGSKLLRAAVNRRRTPKMKIFNNLPRADYAGLLKNASVLVGNSSSGIIEAALFKLPVVNIGNREYGRMHSTNVIHVSHQANKITAAIKRALSPEFKKIASKAKSLYGDGRSARRILEILRQTPIDDKLLIKRLTY